MFWVFYMMFSIFRSHRNRFYWQNGKLHFVKRNRQLIQGQQRRRLTPQEEQQDYQHNIRQWIIFYGLLLSVIIAVLIRRVIIDRNISTWNIHHLVKFGEWETKNKFIYICPMNKREREKNTKTTQIKRGWYICEFFFSIEFESRKKREKISN